ncbi:hypothetical protein OH720_30295 [Pseudomonas sp. WJP1]|uniref:hypothetical protein n=1 Tax=Pseudomonas sp. WJP1 TaxID=2986947 RepID=UPI00234A6A55|nr:hypothetical protein [Pseudomonas sp. WJP1]WCM51174.1 hypothetical protein OH720_30295 [Pseudomonas sp. WJP1]
MHTTTAIIVRVIALAFAMTAGSSAMGSDMDCTNPVTRGGKNYCDPNPDQLDYKNRKNSAADHTNTGAAASAIQSIGNYLQDQSDRNDEQERQQGLEQDDEQKQQRRLERQESLRQLRLQIQQQQ